MRLMKFTGHDGRTVVVNVDALIFAEPFRQTTHAKEQTKLWFAGLTFVVIDKTVDAFLDLMTR